MHYFHGSIIPSPPNGHVLPLQLQFVQPLSSTNPFFFVLWLA
ncbi:hypothetical protein SLEP1_g34594 [Rubroshorea leprosula]|uniref:Uncharacterized protein n=1 Tax=Rubroshorea leprosula TaxID=152421 RepID=A0AAV5KKF8_9ROSI|nr:hypothetical protein SLEP1_g34594 [Rubroshorea leprosula]